MSTWLTRTPARTRLGFAGLAALLLSCTEAPMAGPHAQMQPAESQRFFAAAVESLAGTSQAPVRVDPRPLRPESALRSVTESDLLLTDTATIRLRTATLTAAGLPLADAIRDWGCVFASGLERAGGGGNDPIWEQIRAATPDSVRAHREACRQHGSYTSLVFGPPQAGTDPEHPRWWRIRAMRMMLHGWEIVDLFLEPRANGAWDVVHTRVRVGAFS
jgi:hypothetical protein